MKRQILEHRRGDSSCCPGHDKLPEETYNSRRSKAARARDKKLEHGIVRAIDKRKLVAELDG